MIAEVCGCVMEEARALAQFAVCPNRGLGTPAGGDGSLHSGLCPMEESHIWKKPIIFILPTQLRGELTPVLFLSGSGSVKIGAAYTGFPGGPVVKNPPANAGDMGLIPGLGKSHMLWCDQAHAPQLLSLSSRPHKLQLQS